MELYGALDNVNEVSRLNTGQADSTHAQLGKGSEERGVNGMEREGRFTLDSMDGLWSSHFSLLKWKKNCSLVLLVKKLN